VRDKTAVGADLYIEDTPKHVQSLREDGHAVIVFTNSTNRGVPAPRADSWEDVERLVIEHMEKRTTIPANDAAEKLSLVSK
jgi:hypothetical protein